MKIPFLIAFAFVVSPTLLPAADDPLELGPFGIGSCHVRGRNAGDSKRGFPA